MTEHLKEGAIDSPDIEAGHPPTGGASVVAEAAEVSNAERPNAERETGQRFGDVRDKLGTKLVRRTLKTNDIWYVIKILGKVSKDAREKLLESGGQAAQIDVMALMLTEGVDKAKEEINAWFSDLTGIPAQRIDSEDIGLYMDILEDLDVVGIDGFLGRLIPWYRKKNFGRRTGSSTSE